MTKWHDRHIGQVLGVHQVMADNSCCEGKGREVFREEMMLKASLERKVGVSHGARGREISGRHGQYHGGRMRACK